MIEALTNNEELPSEQIHYWLTNQQENLTYSVLHQLLLPIFLLDTKTNANVTQRFIYDRPEIYSRISMLGYAWYIK